MKKKIYLQMVLLSLIVLLLTFSVSAFAYRSAFARQTESNLEQTTGIIAAVYEDSGSYDVLRDCAKTGPRITLIGSDGDVLFESNEAAAAENHLNRPEVISALASGNGHDSRTSATLGVSTFYYAVLLSSGDVLRTSMESPGFYSFFNSVLPVLALVLACILALSLLLSVILTKALVKPIETMAENLDNIDSSIPYPELRPFAMNVKHQQDVKKEVEQLRQDFTANVSHELKTPLTSISGYAEMIETGIAKQEDVPSFASKIHFEASRLLNLIGDIIQLSELDTLSGTDDFAPADLLDVAKAVEGYLSMSAETNGLRLEVKGVPVTVRGNRSQLEEVAYNLCDNAIGYNKPGGSVTIISGYTDGFPSITVSDTGIGIPPEHIKRIFERFYRVDKGRSKKTGGTGLGLAIVKHIALRHGAVTRVESQVGKGTTISIIFENT